MTAVVSKETYFEIEEKVELLNSRRAKGAFPPYPTEIYTFTDRHDLAGKTCGSLAFMNKLLSGCEVEEVRNLYVPWAHDGKHPMTGQLDSEFRPSLEQACKTFGLIVRKPMFLPFRAKPSAEELDAELEKLG